MLHEPNKKIKVSVEVTIEGFEGAPVVCHQETSGTGLHTVKEVLDRRGSLGIDVITTPTSSGAWPVSSGNLFAASGRYTGSGQARSVFALGFPNTTSSAQQYPTPPSGAVNFPANADGTWSYGSIPGAACDSNLSAGPNSTLLVWYDIGTGSGPVQLSSTIDCTIFHGANPSCPPAGPAGLPQLFYVTFSGRGKLAGSIRKSIPLTWNGVSWIGRSSDGGDLILAFRGNDPHFELTGAGPAAVFVVAAKKAPGKGFHWKSEGHALGQLDGNFVVTVTE